MKLHLQLCISFANVHSKHALSQTCGIYMTLCHVIVCSCWLDRPAFYYAFALPVGIVIVTNAVIFVFIIKGITCDRASGLQSTQTRGELNLLQLQAAIASFVILGGSSTFTFQFPVVSLYKEHVGTWANSTIYMMFLIYLGTCHSADQHLYADVPCSGIPGSKSSLYRDIYIYIVIYGHLG